MNKESTYLGRKRNQQWLKFRVFEGVKAVIRPPCFGLLLVAVLAILFYVALHYRTTFFDFSKMSMQFEKIANLIMLVALVMVFLVFLLGILVMLGTPHKRKLAESSASRAFHLQNTPELCPILISSRRMRDSTRRWEFFSQWVTMDNWQNSIGEICHTLGCHLVGQIERGGRSGNNPHKIVFYTQKGAASPTRDDLIDNEF